MEKRLVERSKCSITAYLIMARTAAKAGEYLHSGIWGKARHFAKGWWDRMTFKMAGPFPDGAHW